MVFALTGMAHFVIIAYVELTGYGINQPNHPPRVLLLLGFLLKRIFSRLVFRCMMIVMSAMKKCGNCRT